VHIWAYDQLITGVHADNNTLFDCLIYNNGQYGVLISAYSENHCANNNIISDCEIYDNGYSGISIQTYTISDKLSYCENNEISNSEFYNNGGNGDEQTERSCVSFLSNGIINNTLIYGCNFFDLVGKYVYISQVGTGISTNATIYDNNFFSDSISVYDNGFSFWYNTLESNGNFYSFYDEPAEGAFDNDSNGIIDISYNISGGSNQDLYPLSMPIDMFIPVALGNGPFNAYVNQNLTFDASKSSDYDGIIVLYKWNLGNTNIRYGKTVKYAYTKAGTYTVTLTVEDDYGLKDTYTTTATIKEEPQEEPEEPVNMAPLANAGGPYYEFVGVPVFFDGSDSYDPDGTDLIFKWSFGDGATSNLEMPNHSYSKDGNFSVRLTVTDNEGATDNATTFALITKKPNHPPDKPKIVGTTTSHINTTCNYTVNGSDPDYDKIKYVVNWSDGTNDTESTFLNKSTSFNTSHNWSTGGIYVITVYSLDENNASSDVQTYKVLIDVHNCGSLGYLIDKNGDGIYDIFYRETTGKETIVEKNDSDYNIDINDDTQWDYIYNFTTNKIIAYPNAVGENQKSYSIELKWIFLIFIIGAFLVITIIKIVINAKRKNIKNPAKEKIYYIEKKDEITEKDKIAQKIATNKKELDSSVNKSNTSTNKIQEKKLKEIENLIDKF